MAKQKTKRGAAKRLKVKKSGDSTVIIKYACCDIINRVITVLTKLSRFKWN